MATTFETKTWVDRVSEYPARRTLTDESGTATVYTVTRNEGTVSEEGDAFSAENMNDLESRIATAVDAKLDGTTLVSDYDTAVTTTETGTAPDCTVIAEMYQNFTDGCSTVAAALNSVGVATASNASPSVMANNIVAATSTAYENGYAAAKVGTASAAQVLNAYTFTNAGSVGATGTMNNWGSNTVNMSSNTATLSAGYYSGITINAASRYTAGYNAHAMTRTLLYNCTYSYTSGSSTTPTATTSGSLNAAAYIDDYANLTAANFALVTTRVTGVSLVRENAAYLSTATWYYVSANRSLSYNASNGMVTLNIANASYEVSGHNTVAGTADSYLVYCYHA